MSLADGAAWEAEHGITDCTPGVDLNRGCGGLAMLELTGADVGKKFVTRDGKTATLSGSGSPRYPYLINIAGNTHSVTGMGEYWDDGRASGLDLISRLDDAIADGKPPSDSPERRHTISDRRIQNVLRTLPTAADDRKAAPIMCGMIDYFPLAVAEVARISKVGNDQHNPGQPLHWARSKSTDHADCVVRHMIERGLIDNDGQRHTAKAAWRVMALLQEELEAAANWTPGGER